MTKPIAVLGAGAWGTALAIHLAKQQQPVNLWSFDAAHVAQMAATRTNEAFLPGIVLPDAIKVFSQLADTLQDADAVLIAVPSHAFRTTVLAIKPFLSVPIQLAWATKGLDPAQHQLLHEVARELLGDAADLAVISGPSFAREVALGLPTAITLATESTTLAQALTQRLHTPLFRIYRSNDIIGVQVGGAMKNILAIAVGMSDGLGFGANARAALITRGLAEITRLGVALGGQRPTFTGLAGVGDLVLTCTDDQSRNRRFGLALGAGKSVAIAQQEIQQVIEGVQTAHEIYQVAQRYSIEVPIAEQVYRIIYEALSPRAAFANLLAREPKTEAE